MLTLIDGGLREDSSTSKKEFVSAIMTNTRLMGVVGVYVHWKLPDNELRTEMHQFFYLDAEEFGLDTYECLTGPDSDEINEEVQASKDRLMGGLGGEETEINERELRYLVQSYTEMNLKLGMELPDNPEFADLLKPEIILTRDEEASLMIRQCEPIESDYQVVNYFIMRCAGRDFKGARFLTSKYIALDLFKEHKAATLLRNEIELLNTEYLTGKDSESFRTVKTYLCQSLIEYDACYYILTSQVVVERLKIVGYERLSSERVSDFEAGSLTERPEYITVCQYNEAPWEFTKEATFLTRRSQVTPHDTGRLFMIFKPKNEHVSKRIFRLNEDIIGLYYIMDSGQFLMAAYDRDDMKQLEEDIIPLVYRKQLEMCSKYCFTEPVLFDFVQSDMEDFEEFIDLISEPEQ